MKKNTEFAEIAAHYIKIKTTGSLEPLKIQVGSSEYTISRGGEGLNVLILKRSDGRSVKHDYKFHFNVNGAQTPLAWAIVALTCAQHNLTGQKVFVGRPSPQSLLVPTEAKETQTAKVSSTLSREEESVLSTEEQRAFNVEQGKKIITLYTRPDISDSEIFNILIEIQRAFEDNEIRPIDLPNHDARMRIRSAIIPICSFRVNIEGREGGRELHFIPTNTSRFRENYVPNHVPDLENGRYPLHYVAENRDVYLMQQMLQDPYTLGTINMRDKKGQSSLHLAVIPRSDEKIKPISENQINCVKLLLAHGARQDLLNQENRNAEHYCLTDPPLRSLFQSDANLDVPQVKIPSTVLQKQDSSSGSEREQRRIAEASKMKLTIGKSQSPAAASQELESQPPPLLIPPSSRAATSSLEREHVKKEKESDRKKEKKHHRKEKRKLKTEREHSATSARSAQHVPHAESPASVTHHSPTASYPVTAALHKRQTERPETARPTESTSETSTASATPALQPGTQAKK